MPRTIDPNSKEGILMRFFQSQGCNFVDVDTGEEIKIDETL